MLEASDDGLGAQHGRAGFCCENRVLRLDSGSEAAYDVFCPGPTSVTTEALTLEILSHKGGGWHQYKGVATRRHVPEVTRPIS